MNARNRVRLEVVEHRLEGEQAKTVDLSAERRTLEDDREAWIVTRMSGSQPVMSALPEGLLARLDGLFAIVKESTAPSQLCPLF